MLMGNMCAERDARESRGLLTINEEAAEELKAKHEERKAKREERKMERAKELSRNALFADEQFDLADEFLSSQIEAGNVERVRNLCNQLLEEAEQWEDEQKQLAELIPVPARIFVNEKTGQTVTNDVWTKMGQPVDWKTDIRWLFFDEISVFSAPSNVREAFLNGTYDAENFQDEIGAAKERFVDQH